MTLALAAETTSTMKTAATATAATPVSAPRAELDCAVFEPRDRFDAWSDAVVHSFVPLRAVGHDADDPQPFAGSLVSQPLGRASVSTVAASGVRVDRTAHEIALADPGYIKLGLQLAGYSVVMQDGRDAALAPGDFALYDTTRPYVVDSADAFRMFVVMFPLDALHVDRGTLRELTARRFSGRSGLGAITSSFLSEMSRQLDAGALGGALPLADAVFDLLSATIADRMDDEGVLDEGAQRRALRARVEDYICRRLADPGLTVSEIAGAHHVSVRYLQKLFELQNDTVSGWVRRRRLEESRRELVGADGAGIAISELGARWGFADPAAFARAFRQEFGMPPTQYRAAARESASVAPRAHGSVPRAHG